MDGQPAAGFEHWGAADEETPAGALARHGPVPVLWDPWAANRAAVRSPSNTLAGKLFVRIDKSVEVCSKCSNLRKSEGTSGSQGMATLPMRVYVTMDLDGYSKNTPVTRGLVGDWSSTLSLDVVDYYGPSAVQVGLWESRLWGQDRLLGRFSFPLSDGVPVSSDEKVAVPMLCTCSTATAPPQFKPSFPPTPTRPPELACSPSSPPRQLPAVITPSCLCLPLPSLPLRRCRSNTVETARDFPLTPSRQAAGEREADLLTAEEIVDLEMAALRDSPASRRQWYMLKPVGRGPRLAFLLDMQYIALKSCTCVNKDTGVNELQRAALLGKTEVVEAILRDVGWSSACSQRTASGYTALDYATLRGDVKSMQLLLENAAERFFQEVAPLTPSPLHMAVRNDNPAVLNLLLHSLRLVSIGLESSMLAHRDEEGRTPLALACALGHLEAVQAVVKRFADPSARDLNKNTPLHLACRRGHLHIVKYLLTLRGAAPSSPFAPSLSSSSSSSGPSSSPLAPDAFLRGASPATTALAPPRSSLASLTALPCAFNADGDTPLLLAARYGHVDIARALLKKGVPAIDENKQGRTALHEAAVGGHSGIIRLFVDHLLTTLRRKENRRRAAAELRQAANWLMAQDIQGKSPLSLATANNHREVVALLVASAMEVNSLCGVKPSPSGSSIRSEAGDMEEDDEYVVAFDMLSEGAEARPASEAISSCSEGEEAEAAAGATAAPSSSSS